MARIVTKIGDIFAARLGNDTLKYFQFIAIDGTQLGSSVIRVFEKTYQCDSVVEFSEVVKDKVEFFAHCILKVGIMHGYWTKVGTNNDVGELDVTFRDTSDYGHRLGDEPVRVSKKWWVWKINEKQKFVGELSDENKQAEIGIVFAPDNIVHRMQTGRYDCAYPEYE